MTSPEVRLLDLPHEDARRAASGDAPLMVLVNPVEFHGPHLSLHNDHVISLGLARRLHTALGPLGGERLLLVDDLELGWDPTPGLGTRQVPYRGLVRAIREACRALVELGARRVIFLTFHGAPLHASAIEEGVKLLREHGVKALNPFNVILEEMLHFRNPERFAAAYAHLPHDQADEMMRTLNFDFHAGFFETSVAMQLAPATVSEVYRTLPPCPPVVPEPALLAAGNAAARAGRDALAEELRFAAYGVGWRNVRPFPGYTSHPSRATPESGAVFVDELVRRYAAVTRDVFDGAPPPPPPLPWLQKVTLNGRLAMTQPPSARALLELLR